MSDRKRISEYIEKNYFLLEKETVVEKVILPLLNSLVPHLNKALKEAGVKKEKLHFKKFLAHEEKLIAKKVKHGKK